MTLPIVIQDDEIIFNYSPDSSFNNRTYYELLTWSTPWGYIIPYDHTSINLKLYMFTGMVDQDIDTVTKGLLLSNDGILRKLSVYTNEGRLIIDVEMLDHNFGNKRIIGTSESCDTISALFSLNFDNKSIMKFIIDNTTENTFCYGIHSIENIIETQLKIFENPLLFHSSILTRNMCKDADGNLIVKNIKEGVDVHNIS